ncbi:MAG: hypothetical protein JW818_00250 [Pirellulales bacterium]|nr:hypothetical protein [Pirellulales bacterium]
MGSHKRRQLRFIILAVGVILSATVQCPGDEEKTRTHYTEYASRFPDPLILTYFGVVGHHRTFCVTFSGNIGDAACSQRELFLLKVKKKWLLGVDGLHEDAVGLAIDRPDNFWGAAGKLEHRLADGRLPIVITTGKWGNYEIEQTAFACLPDGHIESQSGREPLLAQVRVRVKNTSSRPQRPVLWVWRSRPIAAFGEIGGLTRRFEKVALQGANVIGTASGNCHLVFKPGDWSLSDDPQASTKDIEYFGRLSTELPPGQTREFTYVYPYWPLTPAQRQTLALDKSFDRLMAEVAQRWRQLLERGMRISVPDQRITQAFDTCLINTLFLTRKSPQGLILFDSLCLKPPVGVMNETVRIGHYNMEFDDAPQKALVYTMAKLGHFQYAREVLDAIFAAQGNAKPQGAFAKEGCLSAGNVTYTAHDAAKSIWMSGTGYTLWAAAEYYKCSGDRAWIASRRGGILAGLNWIRQERNRSDHKAGYEGLLRGTFVCDYPSKGYHPFNDILSYWGMKEIIAVLDELGEDMSPWQKDLKEYEAAIRRVYGGNKTGNDSILARKHDSYGMLCGPAVMSGLYPLESKIGAQLFKDEPPGGWRIDRGWYALYHIGFLLDQGNTPGFLKNLYSLLGKKMSHTTHSNTEWVTHRPWTEPFSGDRPHVNVQSHDHPNAAFHFLVQRMLLYEDARAIHLAQGVPADWLSQNGLCIQVKNTPTQHGTFDYEVLRENKTLRLRISRTNARAAANQKIRFYLPDGLEAAAIEINGKPSDLTGRSIELAVRPAHKCQVTITLR